MDILVSGQSGLMIVFGKKPQVISVDGQARGYSGSWRALLSGATDTLFLRVRDLSEATYALKKEWAADRALRLFLLFLDDSEPTDLRYEFLDAFDKLLTENDVATILFDNLLSSPLPRKVNVDEAQKLAQDCRAASGFVRKLFEVQPAVKIVRTAFDAIPFAMFGGETARAALEEKLIRVGAFRQLVLAFSGDSDTNFVSLKLIAENRNLALVNEVVRAWGAGIRDQTAKASRPVNVLAEEHDDDADEQEVGVARASSRRAFENALEQQSGIIEKLKQRDLSDARRFASQMVEQQLTNSTNAQIAMSLCRLAQAAKALSVPELQIEWAAQATDFNPQDPKTFGHLADGLINASRFDEAYAALDMVEKVGDPLYSATGRARISRALGHYEVARELYVAAIDKFKGYEGLEHARAGAAETLRDQNKYAEALQEYEELINDYPLEASLYAGKASVLMDLGRLDEAVVQFGIAAKHSDGSIPLNGRATAFKLAGEFGKALSLYDSAIEKYPNDAALLCGKAEVFRAQGDLPAALEAYNIAIERAPFIAIPVSGKAEVLKEMGRLQEAGALLLEAKKKFKFEESLAISYASLLRAQGNLSEALVQYDDIIRRFPFNVRAKIARANVLKRLNRSEQALLAYEDILQTIPGHQGAITAKASVLISLNRFDEALKLLPEKKPASQSDWTQFMLRAMIRDGMNDTRGALKMLEIGIRNAGFARIRRFFRATLAHIQLRESRIGLAAKVAEGSTEEITNVIYLHTVAAERRVDEAVKIFRAISDSEGAANYRELSAEIVHRYGILDGKPKHNRRWIFAEERRALLAEAA